MAKKAPATPAPFREHAEQALGRLRVCFEEIIGALPEPVTRASELQHALDIDKVLGWRIFNVIKSPDAFAAARHVPGANGVKIFVQAAERRGVPASITASAMDALSEYRRLARVHARDRRSLEMLLAAQSPAGRAEADVAHRRDAFRANSYIWGVRAQVQLRSVFVNASDEPARDDVVGLRGLIGLERIRPDQAWPLGTALCVTDQGDCESTLSYESLYDVERPDEEAANLFLSDPHPDIRCTQSPGQLHHLLLPGPVGKTGLVNCVTGEIVRRATFYRWSEDNTWYAAAARIQAPCELLIFDQFIHEDLFGQVSQELQVFAPLTPDARYETGEIPTLETVRYAGKASVTLRTPEVPKYNEMLHYVFRRMGWDPAKFDVYRVRMQYPVMPSYVRVRHLISPPASTP